MEAAAAVTLKNIINCIRVSEVLFPVKRRMYPQSERR
jgi:hypothetical protein